jgi:hypothetical protein
MTQGHMDRSGGGAVCCNMVCYTGTVHRSFFPLVQNGCDPHDRRWRNEDGGGAKANYFFDWRKIIRIAVFLTNQRFYPTFWFPSLKNPFLSFPFLLIGRDHPPTRPGRSSTPIFILRTGPGTFWEGPGNLPPAPVPLPACDFGPSGTKSLLVLMWGLGPKVKPAVDCREGGAPLQWSYFAMARHDGRVLCFGKYFRKCFKGQLFLQYRYRYDIIQVAAAKQ